MLKEKLNDLIAHAMKSKENERLEVLRLIKAEFVTKEKDGVVINEINEAKILNKMISQRKDSISQFKAAKRMDLVENEIKEMEILREFAPKEATDDEIIKEVETVISNMESTHILSMKDMKFILGEVQKKYPTANGKVVSSVIKSKI